MILMVEAVCSSETSVNFYQATRRHTFIVSAVRTSNPRKFGNVPKSGAENNIVRT
jgi:hypothetical protein